jgi:diguanylate cyclase (GGDEF)-like protein
MNVQQMSSLGREISQGARRSAGDLPRLFADRAAEAAAPSKRLVSARERATAYAMGGLLLAAAVAATPFVSMPWPQIPGFLVAYSTSLFMLDVLVGVLLIARARIDGNRAHLLLATAYLYAGFIVIPHIATFPNVLVPGMILGVPGSAVWLWVFWHAGFAALVIAYGLFSDRFPGGRLRVLGPFLAAVLLATLAAYIAIDHLSALPTILTGQHYFQGTAGRFIQGSVMALTIGALVTVIAVFRLRNAQDLWLTIGLIGACVDVWLTLAAGQRYSLGWYCGRICGVSTVFVLFGSLLNDVLLTYGSVAAANDVLDKLTLTDALTNLGNRRLFDDLLEKEWRRGRRDNMPLAVIMIDVDEFKSFNDTYGHQAGDACLQRIALCLQASATRPGDMAVRYGGEEFALILPNTDNDGAEYLARQVQLRIRDLGMTHGGSAKQIITVSAGVASLIPSESFEMTELVRLADIALYRAKAAGRDTIIVAG